MAASRGRRRSPAGDAARGRRGQIAATAEASDRVVLGARPAPRRRHARGRGEAAQAPQGQEGVRRSSTTPTRCGSGTTTSGRPSRTSSRSTLDALEDTIAAVVAEAAAAETDAAAAARRGIRRRRVRRDAAAVEDAGSPYPATLPRPRDLTPAPRRTVDPDQVALSPDGSTVVAAVRVAEQRDGRFALVAIDVESGAHTTLFDEEDVDFEAPAISHDGSRIAYVRTSREHTGGPCRHRSCGPPASTAADPRRHRRGMGPLGDVAPRSTPTTRPSSRPPTRTAAGRSTAIPLDGSAPEQLTHDDFAYTQRRRRPRHAATSSRSARPGSRHPHPVRIARDGTVTPLASPAALPDVPRIDHRGRDDRRRRRPRPRLAAPPRRGIGCRARTAAAVDPRRPAGQLERLELAMEPAAGGRPRLRGAAARSRAVHRLRPRLHRARLEQLGRQALHRPHVDHRRGRRARRHRRDPHRRDGRIVRRLHGQLGRRPHRPVPRDRHAREPVGARPVRRHHRQLGVLAADLHARGDGGALAAPVRARHPHPAAGDPRRPRLPRADRREPAAVVGARRAPRGGRRHRRSTASSTTPTRTTGCSSPSTPWSGTRRCSRSSTSTSTGRTGSGPELLGSTLRTRPGAASSAGVRPCPGVARTAPRSRSSTVAIVLSPGLTTADPPEGAVDGMRHDSIRRREVGPGERARVLSGELLERSRARRGC